MIPNIALESVAACVHKVLKDICNIVFFHS